MKRTHQLTGIIEREGDGYVALCPELDIASHGDTVEAARQNLVEALELFFETAGPEQSRVDSTRRSLSRSSRSRLVGSAPSRVVRSANPCRAWLRRKSEEAAVTS